jgi:hypothetical protein
VNVGVALLLGLSMRFTHKRVDLKELIRLKHQSLRPREDTEKREHEAGQLVVDGTLAENA